MAKREKKRSIFARIRNYFIAGMVVLIPIGITVYLTIFLVSIKFDRYTIFLNFLSSPFWLNEHQILSMPSQLSTMALHISTLVHLTVLRWLTRMMTWKIKQFQQQYTHILFLLPQYTDHILSDKSDQSNTWILFTPSKLDNNRHFF